MKNTKKASYKALSLIFVILSTGHHLCGQSLLGGSLQFAKNATLDEINIYHCGKTITTQKHAAGIPKITYEIPKGNEQTTFFILICPTAPKYSLKKFLNQEEEQNTIDYLKIDPQTPYLFYKLELLHDEPTNSYSWNIAESTLPATGQIPDTAIIMTYFPTFIKAIKGGSQLELPTIFIDNSATDIFGSEENFEEAVIKMQLSSLDLNALHAPTKRKIKADNRRLLIMDTIT